MCFSAGATPFYGTQNSRIHVITACCKAALINHKQFIINLI